MVQRRFKYGPMKWYSDTVCVCDQSPRGHKGLFKAATFVGRSVVLNTEWFRVKKKI